jgi:hypothetical protein
MNREQVLADVDRQIGEILKPQGRPPVLLVPEGSPAPAEPASEPSEPRLEPTVSERLIAIEAKLDTGFAALATRIDAGLDALARKVETVLATLK